MSDDWNAKMRRFMELKMHQLGAGSHLTEEDDGKQEFLNLYRVLNTFCHHCNESGLSFLRWGKRGKTVQMRCFRCGRKEWRKVIRRDSE